MRFKDHLKKIEEISYDLLGTMICFMRDLRTTIPTNEIPTRVTNRKKMAITVDVVHCHGAEKDSTQWASKISEHPFYRRQLSEMLQHFPAEIPQSQMPERK
jgi:hypothetical protein